MSSSNKHIIWLASYPKSGNTWVRMFLTHILNPEHNDGGFDKMTEIPISSNRYLLDRYLGVSSSELTNRELQDLRPEIYRDLAQESKKIEVLKVHDAFGYTSGEKPLFPADITKAVVYIIRNPLDIVVSYARHSNISLEESIRRINNSEFCISDTTDALKAQIPQFLGSWSNHVNSWLQQDVLPVILVRYEDLLANSRSVFTRLLLDLGLEVKKSLFDAALLKSSFKYLQTMEKKYGFREKPIHADAFFVEGRSGYYKKHLTGDQIQNVINAHQDLMRTFGYLNNGS